VFLRGRSVQPPQSETAVTAIEPAPAAPVTLLVSKGTQLCWVPVEQVECINAAGNYVEIIAGGQSYLMRTPLKRIEEMLPASCFARIHRSHIVNRRQIERIKTRPSGNGTVHLRNGQLLKMSKKYRNELRQAPPHRPSSPP